MDIRKMSNKIEEVVGCSCIGHKYLSERDNEVVMIGDVLDWMFKNVPGESEEFDEMVVLLCNWSDNYREPLENQSNECVKYVYDLIIKFISLEAL